MILNQRLAQKFVDDIIENLGYNVNIMNQEGVIIASGFKDRIHTYHKIAEEVIKKKERIDISKKDINQYLGVKEGINMPFYYNGSIVGVIGITGEPEEIENTAQMVKMAVELMLEQEYLKEQIYSHQSQKTFFVNKLLSLDSEEGLISILHWGKKLGYDLNLPRVVCIFSISRLISLTSQNPLMTKERVKDIILNSIKSSPYHSKQDISSYMDVDKIIVFKTIHKQENIKEEILKYVDSINHQLNERMRNGFLVGVGTLHSDLYDLKESFLEAKAMIQYGIKAYKAEGILFTEDHIFEYLFTQIPKKHLDHFFHKFANEIEEKKEMIETVEGLIKNNMNVIQTSKDLFVHRNTIIFRINKIKELFEIDPLHNDDDRLLLRLLYLYLRFR